MFKTIKKKAALLLPLRLPTPASTGPNENDPAAYGKVLDQVHDFETALMAMDCLLDDRTLEGKDLLDRAAQHHKTSGAESPAGIFPLALGVMQFIEATLGFELEQMARAHNTLSEAESIQLLNAKYNAKHNLYTSAIYPPGTEFQVTYAELTLLNALVMLLQENNSIMDGAKALLKLRRAYQTLDSMYKRIKEQEPHFNRNVARMKRELTQSSLNLSAADLPGFKLASASSSAAASSSSLPADLKLMTSLEKVFEMRKSRIEGSSLSKFEKSDLGMLRTLNQINGDKGSQSPASGEGSASSGAPNLDSDDDVEMDFHDAATDMVNSPSVTSSDVNSAFDAMKLSRASLILCSEHSQSGISIILGESSVDISNSALHVSTTDEFIHLGVQLCFGILQVVLSLIPPTIGLVLSIVGFRGDRDTGLKMLWTTAITCRNIHGALALLCLLVLYDGPIQFVDVGFQFPGHEDSNVKNILDLNGRANVRDEELDMILRNPALYTPQLLRKAAAFFPHNALWVLQEGRILVAQGHLHRAIDMMQSFSDDKSNVIRMQQVEALLVFDRATFYGFAHEFDKAARDFIALIDINSWSKGVYLFMAASCYVAKYRAIRMELFEKGGDEPELKAEAEKYRALATKYFELAPTYVPGHGNNASKKGGIGGSKKQMPFDKFLLRKMESIEARRSQYPNVDIVDLVGTSLFHELLYFWNAHNRMPETELKRAIKHLGYSGAPDTPYSANSKTGPNFASILESEDEAMIRYFMQAVMLRLLGKPTEGMKLLKDHVLSKYVIAESPQFRFVKMTYSPYLYPTALYEMSMFVWLDAIARTSTVTSKTLKECQQWLKHAETVGEGDYELSNRTGMKIKAAADRLTGFEILV